MRALGWLGIVRLGLVQMSLGSIVVLATSTLNRIMVVEIALPAVLPGALIALHYAVQALRPRWGYGSDGGRRVTPWIVGGMAVLATGGTVSAAGVALMASHVVAGAAIAVLGFLMVGMGAGAAGTTLLVLLAKNVDAKRRAPAATIVWIMMIAGIAITATLAGGWLDPYSPTRLVQVFSVVSVAAFLLSVVAVRGVESGIAMQVVDSVAPPAKPPFREALRLVWAEPAARRFTIFLFVSMLAYSAQDLVMEPFAGAVFAMTPGDTTKLTGLQHAGVLVGMIMVAIAAGRGAGLNAASARAWTSGGCIASASALLVMVVAAITDQATLLRAAIFGLGLFNGVFAAAAIGSMMALAKQGHGSCEGIRMGVFGAAQGIAFGCGGLVGMIAVDLARLALGASIPAYSVVLIGNAGLFVAAAALAAAIGRHAAVEDANESGLVTARVG